ncbi:2-amino-4-hydroxy-6-hydroxymethyldihydropteridine pyrophosphokinase [Enhygromyxa salina]|uniref:2-amino-4-hydroxy-6-hydroxymethyldihydropteridine pyrophosphokinase n=1 Tax=Enhygromyxa salina TaxID=215803 RepID=A0A2S9XI82_9BACT|nr:2-amino-4-hydroxy-6-hydroxymethyldihydropteridine diphosphokinase [Enhygromyxa salina]PRP92440.1 2-amino-4-hydroxy-6-hydroxymethyldihydropteridine pyrophosphokinase [Enhygromyxa salina]
MVMRSRELDPLYGCSGRWGSGAFLNGAVELVTTLDGEQLLAGLLEIERHHGRVRRERWGDRTLDLDVVCGFDERGRDRVRDTPTLTLPHPNLWARDFVLQPLVDIDAGLRVEGRSCAAQLATLADDQRTLLRRLDETLDPR